MTRPPATMFISPAGALMAVICFFLPWFEFSRGGQLVTFRGATWGGPYWAIPVSALLMIAAFVVAWMRGRPELSRPWILALSLVLPQFLAVLVGLQIGLGIQMGLVSAGPNSHAVVYGLVGMLTGLTVALVGTLSLKAPPAPDAWEKDDPHGRPF